MAPKLTLEVQNWTEERVYAAVAEMLVEQNREGINERVKSLVEQKVQTEVDRISEDLIRREVLRVLEEGWTETTTWGEKTGKRFTVRQRIEGVLFAKKQEGSYPNQYETTLVDRIVREVTTAALHKELKAEIEDAQKRFRAAVDDVIKSKLVETLKGALGLR